jgi:hypothetical protein
MSEPARDLEGLEVMEENAVMRRARINRPKWEPKKWHPVYHEVVLLSALGYKNTEIAAEKGFTTVHISNILNTPQAKVLFQILSKRLEKRYDETIEQRMEKVANKAMSRVEEVINNDTLFEKNPLGIFDRAIVALKGANKIKEEEKEAPKGMMVPAESMVALVHAIQTSLEVKEMHKKVPLEVSGAVIEDAKPHS